jgi:predicted DNA-binding transcriptional regulator AlpA
MRVRSISHLNRPMAVSEPRPHDDFPPASLSEREAARYIGMSAAWLKKSRTRRFLRTTDAPPFVRAGARRIVYRRIDLDEWQRDRVARVGQGNVR